MKPKQSSYQRRRRILKTVYLDPEQVEALKRLQEATKVPTAVRIREAIDKLLAKHRKVPKKRR